jgi:hypothetical protein
MLNGDLMYFVRDVSRGLRFVWSFWSAWNGALLLAAVQVTTMSGAAAQAPSQPAGDQGATIRGVVLSTVDNKPIPGVRVTIDGSDLAKTSDSNGQFAFTSIPLRYVTLDAEKPGFLCRSTQFDMRPNCYQFVDLQSNDGDVTLTMMPQGVVTGRIVDQTGKPVEKLLICLMERKIENGLFAWVRVSKTSQRTNAEGAFRITDIEPGTYLLHTSIMPDPEHSGYGYAGAYYPSTLSQNEAMRVVIHAGDELKLDLKVTDQEFQPVSVNYWHHEWKTGGEDWSLFHETDSTDWNHYATSRDSFEVDLTSRDHLYRMFAPAGEYTVHFRIYPPNDPVNGKLLLWPDGTKKPYLGSVTFTVKDKPVTLTEVPSQHPIDIRLHARSELAQHGKRKAARRQCEDHYGTSANFTLKDQLTHGAIEMSWQADCGPSNFEFKHDYPGRYTLEATDPQGAYIASVTCGGTNLLREPLVVRPGVPACSIEAVIRDDLSSLSVGFAPQAAAQLTAAGITAIGLALIPIENPLEIPYSVQIELASDPEKLAIPPGTYLTVPFDGRPIAWRDPDERKRLMSLGTIVTLAPGESKTISLDWRSELIDAKIGPMGVAFGRVLQ